MAILQLHLRALWFFVTLILIFTSVNQSVVADPIPIVQDGNNEWVRDFDEDFADSGLTLKLRRFAQLPFEGPSAPNVFGMRTVPGDDRLFVVTQGGGQRGNLHAVEPDGSSSTLIASPHASGIRSMRDVVFHPEFDQVGMPGHGKFYTLQIVNKPTDPSAYSYFGVGAEEFTHGDGLVTEWNATFDNEGTFNGVDQSSSREVMRIATPRGDHPIGQGMFNPYASPGDDDYGLLYFTHGDSYQLSEQAQNGQAGLGKIIRINPLQDGSDPYSVPSSNPFVGDPNVLDEIYTLGHRNNHTLNFVQDAEGGVHMLVGEINENWSEELNLISTGGGNYGWAHYEGTMNPDHGFIDSDDPIFPVTQYGHEHVGPHAITGAHLVDNGSELDGQVFFGDFPTSGDVFTVSFDDILNAQITGDRENLTPVPPERVSIMFDDDDDPSTPSVATTLGDIIRNEPTYSHGMRLDTRFGTGHLGELYVTNKWNGVIYLVENSLPGFADFNGDSQVDEQDLDTWLAGYGSNNAELSQGDANGDGVVDGRDFLIWQRTKSAPSSLQVPEPTAAVSLLIGLALFASRKRFRS